MSTDNSPRFANLTQRLLASSSRRLRDHRAAAAGVQPEAIEPPKPTVAVAPAVRAASPVVAKAPPVALPTQAQIAQAVTLTATEQATVDRVMQRKAIDRMWDRAHRANASAEVLAAMDAKQAAEAEEKSMSKADAVWARAWRVNSVEAGR